MEKSKIKLVYKITPIDFFYFQIRTLILTPYMPFLYLMAFALVYDVNLIPFDFIPDIFKAIPVVVNFLFMILVGVFSLIIFILFTLQDKRIYQEYSLELLEDGIQEEGEFNKNVLYWKGMVKFVNSGHLILIYMSGIQAIIVPKRAFLNKDDQQFFIDFIRRKRAEIQVCSKY